MYELSRFPPVHARSIQHSNDLRVCESMIRQGSKSFFMASLLLPREVRNPARGIRPRAVRPKLARTSPWPAPRRFTRALLSLLE